MDKIIVTVLLMVAGVVASSVLVNAVSPVINQSEGAIISVANAVNERMESDIKVIYAAEEGSNINVWVKNVGTANIGSIELSDIFFGLEGNFSRAVFATSGPPYPYWNYDGGTNGWDPATTIKITIHPESSLSPGIYMVKIVIPNGITDEITFGVS